MTASGVIGLPGQPITVYGVNIVSTSGGGSVVTLRNGSSSSGTIYIQESGTTSKGVTFIYSEGFYFPAGLYVSVDGNISTALISYDQL